MQLLHDFCNFCGWLIFASNYFDSDHSCWIPNPEIEEAVHYMKNSAGWSTYINGMQRDYDQFKKEVHQACEHVRGKARQ